MFLNVWNWWFDNLSNFVNALTNVINLFTIPLTDLIGDYLPDASLLNRILELLTSLGISPSLIDFMFGGALAFFIVFTILKWFTDIAA